MTPTTALILLLFGLFVGWLLGTLTTPVLVWWLS